MPAPIVIIRPALACGGGDDNVGYRRRYRVNGLAGWPGRRLRPTGTAAGNPAIIETVTSSDLWPGRFDTLQKTRSIKED